jgi:hypothetical protein
MNEFLIKIDGQVPILCKADKLKSTVLELRKIHEQKNIHCYELGEKHLIRDILWFRNTP